MDGEAKTESIVERAKAAYKNGYMTIGGRDYAFTATSHAQRKLVLSVYTKYLHELEVVNLSCIESADFKKAERSMADIITFDGMQISKIEKHWEQYPEDWIEYLTLGMSVICYPFLKGKLGG